jgi:hypothetical protein
MNEKVNFDATLGIKSEMSKRKKIEGRLHINGPRQSIQTILQCVSHIWAILTSINFFGFSLSRIQGPISSTCLHTAVTSSNALVLNFYFTNHF